MLPKPKKVASKELPPANKTGVGMGNKSSSSARSRGTAEPKPLTVLDNYDEVEKDS